MKVFGGWVFDREWMRCVCFEKFVSSRDSRRSYYTTIFYSGWHNIKRPQNHLRLIRKQGKKVKSRRRQEMTGAGKYFAPQSQFEATI